MKKVKLAFLIIFSAITVIAQPPKAFKYQAVTRDNSGNIIANQIVSFKVSILESGISGTLVYSETHLLLTNQLGLVNLEIGNGTVSYGVFGIINWYYGIFFLKLEIDPSGGNNFQFMGTSQLLTVPYAMNASSLTLTDENGNRYNLEVDTLGNIVAQPIHGWVCGDSLTDIRDGRKYGTVLINSQCWMSENLNIGTKIPGEIGMTDNNIIEKYCYNHDSANCEVYGGLYQWEEVMQYSITTGEQGICPPTGGWHIPTELEWTSLVDFLGGPDLAGGKLKEAGFEHWTSPNTGATNESGFTGLPGGLYFEEYMDGLGSDGYWWTSTRDHLDQKTFYNSYKFTLISSNASISQNPMLSNAGLSVRCINNESSPGFPSVTTSYINDINATSASGGGIVTTQGNSDVKTRGICWSTSKYPTINDPHTINGAGSGTFSSEISGLIPDSTYYVRAYASNNTNTGYGNMVSFVALGFGVGGEPCPGIATVTYEGQVYNTVQIGSQCWFRENLNAGIRVNGSANQINNGQIEKVCYYHEPGYCDIYGGLYHWNEMMQYSTTPGAQGICPAGWHIPMDSEWIILKSHLGGTTVAGGKLKDAGLANWLAPNTGATNESGFSGLPGGNFNLFYFGGLNSMGAWWSSSSEEPRQLSSNNSEFQQIYAPGGWGYSVRCLKN